ncbi:MAG: hypothetical protein PVI77_22495, partial [Desulfobacterales bacterium]
MNIPAKNLVRFVHNFILLYLIVYKNQVTSPGEGFEGEPLRGCVTHLSFRDNRIVLFRKKRIFLR